MVSAALNVGIAPGTKTKSQLAKELGDWVSVYEQKLYTSRGKPSSPSAVRVSHRKPAYPLAVRASPKKLSSPIKSSISGALGTPWVRVNNSSSRARIMRAVKQNSNIITEAQACDMEEKSDIVKKLNKGNQLTKWGDGKLVLVGRSHI